MLLDRGTGRLGDIDTYLRDIECVDLLLCRRFVSFAFDLIGMVVSGGGSNNGKLCPQWFYQQQQQQQLEWNRKLFFSRVKCKA